MLELVKEHKSQRFTFGKLSLEKEDKTDAVNKH